MRFIEMTGKTLAKIVSQDELHARDIESAGVSDETIVRVSELGDIEVRRVDQWDVIGGLLGDYVDRVKGISKLDWA